MRTCTTALLVLSTITALSAHSVADEAAPSTAPPATDLSKSSGTLSDKFDSSNGVIHPSGGIDPKIEKPAPAAGTIRIIPSPDSPTATPK
jgi:hypothetical protein